MHLTWDWGLSIFEAVVNVSSLPSSILAVLCCFISEVSKCCQNIIDDTGSIKCLYNIPRNILNFYKNTFWKKKIKELVMKKLLFF